MRKLFVGQVVKVIDTDSIYFGHICTIIKGEASKLGEEEQTGRQVIGMFYTTDLPPPPGYKSVMFEGKYLMPYYDGFNKVSWEDFSKVVPWIPKGEKA